MPYTSVRYALFGVEFYRKSLRDTWRHFVAVLRAMDEEGLRRQVPIEELEDWAYSMTRDELAHACWGLLSGMGWPRHNFVVFAFGEEAPGK